MLVKGEWKRWKKRREAQYKERSANDILRGRNNGQYGSRRRGKKRRSETPCMLGTTNLKDDRTRRKKRVCILVLPPVFNVHGGVYQGHQYYFEEIRSLLFCIRMEAALQSSREKCEAILLIKILP
ncbi:hypothetical protein R1flu_020965 [Riccia fluitans]|uniref:Uncharacterized protein n=1 Tax=Riccia fluitans TaxID=41844 RepID=A0ABD1ZP74_9MARC